MIGIFAPDDNQLFLATISRGAYKEKYRKPLANSENTGKNANDGEDKEDKREECPFCCNKLNEDTIMERWPCNVDYNIN
jgi:hypothetical protein